MSIPKLQATVTAEPADAWDLGNSALLEAAVAVLKAERPELVSKPAQLRFTTTIPRQVGMSGSTAIITAALRVLADRSDHTWDPVELARLALHAETEVLGWSAGPQDRVVIAYEGVLDMDFARPWNREAYVPLKSELLPPLFAVWPRETGTPSTVVHSNIRERWSAGDRQVVDTMASFAELASEGRRSLDLGRASEVWPELMRRSFALRNAIWDIAPADRKLVEIAADFGAGATLAGSGGAIVGCHADRAILEQLMAEYQNIAVDFLVLA